MVLPVAPEGTFGAPVSLHYLRKLLSLLSALIREARNAVPGLKIKVTSARNQ